MMHIPSLNRLAPGAAILLVIFAPALCLADSSWPPAPPDLFRADIYPSPSAAATAAGRRAAAIVSSEMTATTSAPMVRVEGAPEDAVRRVRRALALNHPEIVVTDGPEIAGETITVRVTGATDAIDLVVTTPGERRAESFAFAHKRWVEERGPLVTVRDGHRRIVVRGDSPGASIDEAGDIARRQAVEMIVPLVLEDQSDRGLTHVREGIARGVDAAIAEGQFIADSFTCRLSRPYGDVWYQALLIEVPEDALTVLRHEALAERNKMAARRIGGFAASALLVGVLLVLYAGTNAITRGYFTGRLRLALVCLVVTGVWLIVTFT